MNEIAINNERREPKQSILADGYKYLFNSTKDFIDKYPLHAEHKFTPLEYHGYKETPENIKHVIEELEYEITVHPQYTDILLDKMIAMKQLLSKHELQPPAATVTA
jgi:hypothetical protein